MAGIPLPAGADYWQDCSFVRRAGSGRLVVAYVASVIGTDTSGNLNTGSLEVVVYDDAEPPQPGTPQVLESSLATACRICTRPDGTLDLFYGYDCTAIRHRVSEDGGESWGAPSVIHSSAGPVCTTGPAPFSTMSGNLEGLVAAYAPRQGLYSVWYRGEPQVGVNHEGRYFCGRLDADGETWLWTTPVPDTQIVANPPLKHPQASRDGSLLLHSDTAGIWPKPGGSYVRRAAYVMGGVDHLNWLEEASGTWLSTSRNPSSVGPHAGLTFGVGRWRLDTDLVVRGYGGPALASLPGWGGAPRWRGQIVGQLGVRDDGCWEFLFPQPSGELDFKRSLAPTFTPWN